MKPADALAAVERWLHAPSTRSQVIRLLIAEARRAERERLLEAYAERECLAAFHHERPCQCCHDILRLLDPDA